MLKYENHNHIILKVTLEKQELELKSGSTYLLSPCKLNIYNSKACENTHKRQENLSCK